MIQPMVSEQWFVSMASLAKPAYEAAQDGRITFVPERFKGVYDNWLEGNPRLDDLSPTLVGASHPDLDLCRLQPSVGE